MHFYGNFHHGVIHAFLMNPLLFIHGSLKNLHGYWTITEVMAGLIFLFIISQRQIIAANLIDMTHFDQIKILSSAEFNARLTDVNKETSDL